MIYSRLTASSYAVACVHFCQTVAGGTALAHARPMRFGQIGLLYLCVLRASLLLSIYLCICLWAHIICTSYIATYVNLHSTLDVLCKSFINKKKIITSSTGSDEKLGSLQGTKTNF